MALAAMKCFVYFFHDSLHFRLDELATLLEMNGVELVDFEWTEENPKDSCMLLCDIPSKHVAQEICKRSMTIRCSFFSHISSTFFCQGGSTNFGDKGERWKSSLRAYKLLFRKNTRFFPEFEGEGIFE